MRKMYREDGDTKIELTPKEMFEFDLHSLKLAINDIIGSATDTKDLRVVSDALLMSASSIVEGM